MKKILTFLALFLSIGFTLSAQEIQESCNIIESSVKNHQYYNFTISGDGFLSYNWGDNDDNHTTLSVDLTKVTISKDRTMGNEKSG